MSPSSGQPLSPSCRDALSPYFRQFFLIWSTPFLPLVDILSPFCRLPISLINKLSPCGRPAVVLWQTAFQPLVDNLSFSGRQPVFLWQTNPSSSDRHLDVPFVDSQSACGRQPISLWQTTSQSLVNILSESSRKPISLL